jgi:hypothetical protein
VPGAILNSAIKNHEEKTSVRMPAGLQTSAGIKATSKASNGSNVMYRVYTTDMP